ncbi:MAG: S46 family peptidase [Bacteroidales bacterium]|nr:S46 family peptidase [Bacteroidales bacterium]
MKNLLLLILSFFMLLSLSSLADEGMWIPGHMSKMNYTDMEKLGCKLTPEQIYSINGSSIKDAIFQLIGEGGQGFCTGEIVSEKGLLFTNHHCGYQAIANLSSMENNYLDDGYWARNIDQEIPVPGVSVSRVVRIDNVTERVLADINDETSESDRSSMISKVIREIEKEATTDNHYKAKVKEMYQGGEYYLFIYEEFGDVRFVGAPPSSIGKFGGDTDNWMWPRHTGDFSIFRVYMSPDGMPTSEFAEDNIPYKPLHYLPISIKGLKEGDFTMIMGYPGETERFLSAAGMVYKRDIFDPTLVNLFSVMLEQMKKHMDADKEIRLALADTYAGFANAHKLFKGEAHTLKTTDAIEQRIELEKGFTEWINADSNRKSKYGSIIPILQEKYGNAKDETEGLLYVSIGLLQSNSNAMNAQAFMGLESLLEDSKGNAESITEFCEEMKLDVDEMFDGYFPEADKDVFSAMLKLYIKDIEPEKRSPVFSEYILSNFKGKTEEESIDKFIDAVYSKSIFTDKDRMMDFLNKPKQKTLTKDPIYQYVQGIFSGIFTLQSNYLSFTSEIAVAERLYIEALRKYQTDRVFYPDANSTLRLTYGTVNDYDPRDAVHYHEFTYAEGILEKYVPNDLEFDVDPKLVTLIQNKDYGRYADHTGSVPVCFLSDNDITGGNSGSPILNGEGHLIGLAFDGNWEWLCSNLIFSSELQRTINVDSRYVLWIIDKFANAQYIMNELDIRE